MAESLGSAVLTLSVDDGQYIAGLNRARQATEAAVGGLRSALAGLGIATTVGAAIGFIGSQINQIDSASAAVRTLGVDSLELNQRLRALSVELNNNISTLELTKAAYDVASSGFSSAADATQILRAAATGAKGGFAEVNDVASALTGVLNAYGLSAKDASVLVDQFVQTQADGVITVRQYAAEIGNVASIAAASGISIQELNAAIATATLRGVPVAQTFTGLRQAISSIIKPSELAKDLAQSLGIEFNVSALKAKGLGGVLADVQQKTGGAADKIAILLGSVEAQAAVQPLLNDRLAKYNELLDRQAKAAGAAASASETNAKTISGGLAQIGNGFSNLATTLDTTLTPLLAGFIKDLNDILIKLNQVSALSPEAVKKREAEAVRIVETAAQTSTSSTVRAFYGTPLVGGIELKYDGKTFKGTVNGVRESIAQYLLQKELANINKNNGGTGATPKVKIEASEAARDQANAAVSEELKRQEALQQEKLATTLKELAASKERLREAQAIQGLEGIALEQAKVQLATDKARAEQKKAIADYDKKLAGAGFDRDNPAVIEAAGRVEAAGNNLNAALLEGANALTQSAKDAAARFTEASRQLLDARLKLSENQASPQGLNRFLTGDEVFQRTRTAITSLGPELESALKRGSELLRNQGVGAGRPLFDEIRNIFSNARTGAFASFDGLQKITQFINDVNAEADAISGVNSAQDAVNAINKELVGVNTSLRNEVANLVLKKWDVNVVVQGGQATAYGDVVNGALSAA